MKKVTKKRPLKNAISSYFTARKIAKIIESLLVGAAVGLIVQLLAHLIWR